MLLTDYLCSNFNMPDSDTNLLDIRLETLFDKHSFKPYVANITCLNKRTGKGKILDLLATLNTLIVVSDVRVVSSHNLCHHSFIMYQLSSQRVNLPDTSYKYHNLRSLDTASFEQRLENSSLSTSSFSTADENLDQMEWVIGSLLDKLVPLCTGTRPGGKGSSRWLSPEDIIITDASLSISGRVMRKEADQCVFRTVCWKANKLINE